MLQSLVIGECLQVRRIVVRPGAAHRIEKPGKGARMTSSVTWKPMLSARAQGDDIGLILPEALARQYRAAACSVPGTGSLDLN